MPITVNVTGSQTFKNLMTRCLNHEYDAELDPKHINYLGRDIHEAYNQLDVTKEEYDRLIKQYQLTATWHWYKFQCKK